ncbi:hypothetical protein [Nitrogeniibacter aestuarii]|uniref:hypothetical protein n=1 Tax=Nitrogeniibacter aestuarii TaxID=2815343 RepID=UPI001D0FC4A4|nr:hypothetical protein [Nitrogeniibacter aestuarii]
MISKLVVEQSPQYIEIFRELQGKGKGFRLPVDMIEIRDRLNIGNYVDLYDKELNFGVALFFAFVGENGFKEWSSEVNQFSGDDLGDWLVDFLANFDEFDSSAFFPPESEEEKSRLEDDFQNLSIEDQAIATKRAQWFWISMFGSFHNMLAVMVHGEKMTSLVPRALGGDQDAFCKAIQIDRSLLSAHAGFRAIRQRAHDSGDTAFVRKIAAAEMRPLLSTRLRYPGLYVLFAMLESMASLDEFKDSELLDICDEAGLDRYQNRIEDVGYLTKRRLEFRRFQKSA